MLEKNGRFWSICKSNFFIDFAWNTEQSKNIVVFSCNLVSFKLVIVLSTEFREKFMHVVWGPCENTLKIKILS